VHYRDERRRDPQRVNIARRSGINLERRLTAGVSRARLGANVAFAANATGERIVRMSKNGGSGGGTTFAGMGWVNFTPIATDITLLQAHSAPIAVTAGGYFELRVWQDSGAALDVQAGSGAIAHKSFFALEVLA